jgi:uncharacterized protein DUF6983
MLILPFTADYDQAFRTQVNGETYVVDARWNERGQHWTFDLTRNSDQVLLVAGVPLLSGQDVLSPYALGIGGIVVADLNGTQTDPGPDDLADRAIVVYLSPDELSILAGTPGIVAPGAPPGPSSTASAAGSGGGSSSGGGGITNVITNVSQTINNIILGGGGFSSNGIEPQADDSGDEVVAFWWPKYVGGIADPTLSSALEFVGSGSGTIRMYIGVVIPAIGDTGTPEGTLAGSSSISGSGPGHISGTPVANPSGFVYVKITIQSSAPATSVSAGPLVGAIG